MSVGLNTKIFAFLHLSLVGSNLSKVFSSWTQLDFKFRAFFQNNWFDFFFQSLNLKLFVCLGMLFW